MNKLVDPFQRHINYLRISITDRCNLRCTYCMPPQGIALMPHEEILRFEEIVRIARIAVSEGITRIRITGGEPLVRKGVVELIKSLSRLEGLEDLSMTTNGILLGEFARLLYEAGLKRVNVSIDSLREGVFKKITGGGELGKAWEGIEAAFSVGLRPVKINVVAMKGFNEDEVLDFARLTFSHEYQVRFIEFMPVGMENGWAQGKFLSSMEIKEIIQRHYTLLPHYPGKSSGGPADLFRLEGALGSIGFISALTSHFCDSCNRLRLTADGKLRPCLFSDSEIDVKTVLRSGGDDKEIRKRIHSAIYHKPKGHSLSKPTFRKCSREMVAIGG